MTRTDPQFNLRMPIGMRPRIAALAKSNHRSMNSEIIFHLERVLDAQIEAVAENSLQAGSATVPNNSALQGVMSPTA